jgi:hypothetical protein
LSGISTRCSKRPDATATRQGPLLLTAGQLDGAVAQPVGQPEGGDKLVHPFGLRAPAALSITGRRLTTAWRHCGGPDSRRTAKRRRFGDSGGGGGYDRSGPSLCRSPVQCVPPGSVARPSRGQHGPGPLLCGRTLVAPESAAAQHLRRRLATGSAWSNRFHRSGSAPHPALHPRADQRARPAGAVDGGRPVFAGPGWPVERGRGDPWPARRHAAGGRSCRHRVARKGGRRRRPLG